MSTDAAESERAGFWHVIARLYQNLDTIRDAANRIVEHCDQIDAVDTCETLEQCLSGAFDAAEMKKAFSRIQQEMNTILSCAHEISPHLSNKSYVLKLSRIASLLLAEMTSPAEYAAMRLGVISWGARTFAQSSARLVLNPSRKSIKVAFGVDVGSEWARLKAYIERDHSNS